MPTTEPTPAPAEYQSRSVIVPNAIFFDVEAPNKGDHKATNTYGGVKVLTYKKGVYCYKKHLYRTGKK